MDGFPRPSIATHFHVHSVFPGVCKKHLVSKNINSLVIVDQDLVLVDFAALNKLLVSNHKCERPRKIVRLYQSWMNCVVVKL